MRRTSRTLVAGLATAGLLTLAACGGDGGGGNGSGDGGDAGGEVEVFTWWAEGSEKEGLDALVGVFSEQNPDFEFVNGAVAGGGEAPCGRRADATAGARDDGARLHFVPSPVVVAEAAQLRSMTSVQHNQR